MWYFGIFVATISILFYTQSMTYFWLFQSFLEVQIEVEYSKIKLKDSKRYLATNKNIGHTVSYTTSNDDKQPVAPQFYSSVCKIMVVIATNVVFQPLNCYGGDQFH